MINILIMLYSLTMTFNPVNLLSTGMDLKQNYATFGSSSKTVNTSYSSGTEAEDSWQPIIQIHNWLAVPTTLTPAMSQATLPTSRQNLKFSRRSGENYATQYTKPLIPNKFQSTKSNFSSPLQSIQQLNVMPTAYPMHDYIKSDDKTNNSWDRDKYRINSYHYQQLYPFSNEIDTLYTPIQMPMNIQNNIQENAKNNKHSMTSQLDLQHLGNVAEPKSASNPTSSLTYWHYLPSAQLQEEHIVDLSSSNDINRTSNTTNLHVKAEGENETDKTIETATNSKGSVTLTRRLNSFVNVKNANDDEITSIKNHQHQNHFYTSMRHNDVKSLKTDDKNFTNTFAKATNSHPTGDGGIVVTDNAKEDLNVELFVGKTLKNAQEFYNNIKDIINVISSGKDGNNKADDYVAYLNGDISSDDNQLQSSSTRQVVRNTTTTTVAAALSAALEKIDSLIIKNMLSFLGSTGEAKGRKRQIDEGLIKNSLTKLTAQSFSSSLQVANKVKNTAGKQTFQSPPINNTRASGQLENFPAKSKTVSVLPSPLSLLTKTHASSQKKKPSSKAIRGFISARKVKKLKNKLKKFIIPLLLAYKLKFISLAPLIIAGLVLLMGSSGLAGFFFALFTAVMSLSRRA